ncbi:hypothetical protein NDU88_002167 [Pleurodeles waltl]|uniref:Uncharacterized protein n=1 Tax=Pleurodeles waltl TaxID=8319 RepID=A0AAV7P970_PLEWA|nr:hypothetical protein NDU88_002167 [Pleurodeles waltl]
MAQVHAQEWETSPGAHQQVLTGNPSNSELPVSTGNATERRKQGDGRCSKRKGRGQDPGETRGHEELPDEPGTAPQHRSVRALGGPVTVVDCSEEAK